MIFLVQNIGSSYTERGLRSSWTEWHRCPLGCSDSAPRHHSRNVLTSCILYSLTSFSPLQQCLWLLATKNAHSVFFIPFKSFFFFPPPSRNTKEHLKTLAIWVTFSQQMLATNITYHQITCNKNAHVIHLCIRVSNPSSPPSCDRDRCND